MAESGVSQDMKNMDLDEAYEEIEGICDQQLIGDNKTSDECVHSRKIIKKYQNFRIQKLLRNQMYRCYKFIEDLMKQELKSNKKRRLWNEKLVKLKAGKCE